MKLASGWRPKKVKVDQKCENSSYLLKLFKVDVYYVVCSIDIVKDTIYKQVLKVWDILPMNETAKYFKRLDSIFSMYTENFTKLCNEKLFDRYAFWLCFCWINFYCIVTCMLCLALYIFQFWFYMVSNFSPVLFFNFYQFWIKNSTIRTKIGHGLSYRSILDINS